MHRFVIAALLFAAPIAAAQSPLPEIHEGARVKIRTSTIHAAVGSVGQSAPDSLVIHDSQGARLAVPRSSITQTYVSHGPTVKEGAKRGALWGLGFGAVGALMMIPDPCANAPDKIRCKSVHEGENRANIAAAFFGSCLVTGLGIGAMVKAEEWEEVQSQPRVSVHPHGAGLMVAVNFR